MALKCNICGGDVKFDIPLQQAICDHCGSSINDNKYAIYKLKAESMASAETKEQIESDKIETVIYQCPECGAEVRCFSEELTIYCKYCGKQSFVKTKEKFLNPQYIIPFSLDRNSTKEKYKDFMKRKLFVPKDIKDPNYIEKFTGIYIPYWSYSYSFPNPIVLRGANNYTERKGVSLYDVSEAFDVSVDIEGSISDITFDASRAFEDCFSNCIAPYDSTQGVPFDPLYVADLYIDKETVPGSAYVENADKMILDKLNDEIDEALLTNVSKPIDAELTPRRIKTAKRQANLALLPVWFTTHRKGSRVSYGVINGQTGKIAMDLPVSKKSFFGFVILLGTFLAALFSVLYSTIFGAMSAKAICCVASGFLMLANLLFVNQINNICKRESGNNNTDKSLETVKKSVRKKINKKRKESFSSNCIEFFIRKDFFVLRLLLTILFSVMPIVIIFYEFAPFLFTEINSFGPINKLGGINGIAQILLSIMLIFVQSSFLKRVLKIKSQINIKKSENKYNPQKEIPYFIMSIVLVICSTVCIIFNFAANLIYYAVAISILTLSFVIALRCIAGFEYLTTRSVPNFFKRGEI